MGMFDFFHFVRLSFVNEPFRLFFFSINQKKLISFLKVLFIFHLFHYFSQWTIVQWNRSFNKIACPIKNNRFFQKCVKKIAYSVKNLLFLKKNYCIFSIILKNSFVQKNTIVFSKYFGKFVRSIKIVFST